MRLMSDAHRNVFFLYTIHRTTTASCSSAPFSVTCSSFSTPSRTRPRTRKPSTSADSSNGSRPPQNSTVSSWSPRNAICTTTGKSTKTKAGNSRANSTDNSSKSPAPKASRKHRQCSMMLCDSTCSRRLVRARGRPPGGCSRWRTNSWKGPSRSTGNGAWRFDGAAGAHNDY